MPDEKIINQVTFSGGLNAQAPTHLVGDEEVQLATNVDFSLEWGALVCRRGAGVLSASISGYPTILVTRNYNGTQTNLDASRWYAIGQGTGGFYRGTGTTLTFSQISVGDSAASNINPNAVTYNDFTYLANGSMAVRDNGTSCFVWLLPNPPEMYTEINGTNLTVQLHPFCIESGTGGFNGTWTASLGAFVSAGSRTGTPVLSTLTNGSAGTMTSSGIIAYATVVGSNVISSQTIPNTDFSAKYKLAQLNSGVIYGTGTFTQTIGDFGVDYITLGFSNPGAVTNIAIDCSIGDSNFTNYWHAQTTINELRLALPDDVSYLLAKQANQTYSDVADWIAATRSQEDRSQGRGNKAPASLVQNIPNGVMVWAIPRSNYQLIGQLASGAIDTGWEDIKCLRVAIDTVDQTLCYLSSPRTYGNSLACLSDTMVGYSWFQTYCRVENGLVVAEGQPSVQSQPTGTASDHKAAKFLFGNAYINCDDGYGSGAGTASAIAAGATHRAIYRAGGGLNDAYLVDIFPLTSGTLFFDAGHPDMDCITRGTMTRSLWSSWPTAGVSAISEPFQERVFVGTSNKLYWSHPGNFTAISSLSETVVSNQGDQIQALPVWDRLLIVTNNSVYEMDGSVWEGPQQDWVLRKSGSRRGCAAPKTCIKTPHGILLFSYDGLSLYTPGYGVDTPLDWVMDKVGDLWRGTASTAPAKTKGRIPALRFDSIHLSCAAFADGKLYLAIPTTNSFAAGCDALLVLDLAKKIINYWEPQGFTILSLYWDYAGSRLVAGVNNSANGGLFQLESTQIDLATYTIPWKVRTKTWTTKQDLLLENFSVEADAGLGTMTGFVIVDGTTTYTMGTYSGGRQWFTSPLSSVVSNSVEFDLHGTQTSTKHQKIYQLEWRAQIQPAKLQYLRTPPDNGGRDGEKIWDSASVELEILGTGTVTGVTYLDNLAVMTNTYVGPTTTSQQPFPFPYGTGTLSGTGPVLIPKAFPTETYGNLAYTIYTSTGTVWFKHYSTSFATRPEPSRVTSYVTDRTISKPGMESRWYEVKVDMNCLSSPVTGTLYVDAVATATYTLTGTKRLGYALTVPPETYGNEAWMEYRSVGGVFKHYQTWYASFEEPSRTTSYVTERFIPKPGLEAWWHELRVDMNCLNYPVLATAHIDNLVVGTYTLTGSARNGYSFTYPSETYGNEAWVEYRSVGGTLKHYTTWYSQSPEPSRGTFAETPILTLPSENYVKTWLTNVNPLGGVVTGILYIDGVAVSTATFTGTVKKIFEVGLPNITTGKTLQARYTSSTVFKWWDLGQGAIELEPKPFTKTTWVINYKKAGGFTQFDMARFHSLDVEGVPLSTLTSTWKSDGVALLTNTLTLTASRQYIDVIPFPPGCRGYLFSQEITSTIPFKVWRSNLDIERIGVKGFSRVTLRGTPSE